MSPQTVTFNLHAVSCGGVRVIGTACGTKESYAIVISKITLAQGNDNIEPALWGLLTGTGVPVLKQLEHEIRPKLDGEFS